MIAAGGEDEDESDTFGCERDAPAVSWHAFHYTQIPWRETH